MSSAQPDEEPLRKIYLRLDGTEMKWFFFVEEFCDIEDARKEAHKIGEKKYGKLCHFDEFYLFETDGGARIYGLSGIKKVVAKICHDPIRRMPVIQRIVSDWLESKTGNQRYMDPNIIRLITLFEVSHPDLLHMCLEYGYTPFVRMILSINPNKVNDILSGTSLTTLHAVAKSASLSCLEALIETGGMNEKVIRGIDESTNRSPLHLLGYTWQGVDEKIPMNLDSRPKVADIFVNQFKMDVNQLAEGHETPLFGACRSGYVKLARKLMDPPISADIGICDDYGWSCLLIACHLGHSETVEALLNHPSIDLFVTESGGDNALTMACSLGYLECAKLIVNHLEAKGAVSSLSKLLDQKSPGPSILHQSLRHPCVIEWLLTGLPKECALEIDCRNYCGETPLFEACRWNETNSVAILLKCGAKVYHRAYEPNSVAMLLKYGTKVDHRAQFGRSCLEYIKDVECLKVVWEHAKVNLDEREQRIFVNGGLEFSWDTPFLRFLESAKIRICDYMLKEMGKYIPQSDSFVPWQ